MRREPNPLCRGDFILDDDLVLGSLYYANAEEMQRFRAWFDALHRVERDWLDLKSPSRQSAGGLARAKNMTPERRSEVARKGGAGALEPPP